MDYDDDISVIICPRPDHPEEMPDGAVMGTVMYHCTNCGSEIFAAPSSRSMIEDGAIAVCLPCGRSMLSEGGTYVGQLGPTIIPPIP